MKISRFLSVVALSILMAATTPRNTFACTGISFTAKDNSHVVGRSMEWGAFILDTRYAVVPRGHVTISYTPSGDDGMTITARYGYVGIVELEESFMSEGINEKGLAGQLFYFPNYGDYGTYHPEKNSSTVSDAQFLSWALSNYSTVAEVEKNISQIQLVAYGHGFGNAHFRLADATGRRVVLEWHDGKARFFDNAVGVITNAPSYDWHITNLNNYLNIYAGAAKSYELVPGVKLHEFGIGSGGLGLPGDLTPPSRFIRASFYVHTAPQPATGYDAVLQTFQILNNFDIPIGSEFNDKSKIPDMISATQWTSVTDITHLKFYYRTGWNSTIRCIDLQAIDFGKVKYQEAALDPVREQRVEYIHIQ